MPIERIESAYYNIDTKGIKVYFNTFEDVCNHILKHCDYVRITMKTHADKINHSSQIQDSLNGLKKLVSDIDKVRIEGFKKDGAYETQMFEVNFSHIFVTLSCKNEAQDRHVLDDCMKLINNYKFSAIDNLIRNVRDLLVGALVIWSVYLVYFGFKSGFLWVPPGLFLTFFFLILLIYLSVRRNRLILNWKREQSFWQKNSDGIIISALIAILSVIATGLMTSFIKVYVPQPPATNNLQQSPANLSPAQSHQK